MDEKKVGEGFEVTELEDSDLDDVSGGNGSGCPCTNGNCVCPREEEPTA